MTDIDRIDAPRSGGAAGARRDQLLQFLDLAGQTSILLGELMVPAHPALGAFSPG